MYSSANICPHCKCASVRRSRRRFFDWPLSLVGFKPARCTSCGYRFYRAAAQLSHSSSPTA